MELLHVGADFARGAVDDRQGIGPGQETAPDQPHSARGTMHAQIGERVVMAGGNDTGDAPVRVFVRYDPTDC